MLHHVAHHVYRRFVESGETVTQAPWWTTLLVLANLVVFIPVLVFASYTLHRIYPLLAVVEDENPPAYEPVALDEANVENAGEPAQRKPFAANGQTITSGFRRTARLLESHGGWKANFRGFFCSLALGLASVFLFGIFASFSAFSISPFTSVSNLLVSLALVQLSTAWVHIVITPHSPLPFWRRLPPFKRTFDATAKAVVLYWVASEIPAWWAFALGRALSLPMPGDDLSKPPRDDGNNGAKTFWLGLSVLVLSALSIPAQVILWRIQASLLPVEEDTILPFDRSFQGRVEPAVIDGKGYATIADAWHTFSASAWKRLIKLYIKITIVATAIALLLIVVVIPEALLVARFSTTKENPN